MKRNIDRIQVGNRFVGSTEPPFVVAEMSGNHNGSLARALEIVDAAAQAGAHALKLQTYTAETMTLDLDEGDFFISDEKSLWSGKSLYQLYEDAHTPWDWHEEIINRCKEQGLICFSTPFDESAVDFLEELKVPIYKVASLEIGDFELIRKIASTGKPIIISTGASTIEELSETIEVARSAGCNQLVITKCTSSYPCDPSEINLNTIPYLQEQFNCHVGLSDHTLGIGSSVAAVGLGAVLIEKHFTLSRAEGGVDAAFSLEPGELQSLVLESKTAWEAMGEIQKEPSRNEKEMLRWRRSLYITKDLKPGDILTRENLRSIRPGQGLAPKYLSEVIGKKVTASVKRGTPVHWNFISKQPE